MAVGMWPFLNEFTPFTSITVTFPAFIAFCKSLMLISGYSRENKDDESIVKMSNDIIFFIIMELRFHFIF